MKYLQRISFSIAFLLLLLINSACQARHIDCRKYVFAPRCRGVSAKRSGPIENENIIPDSSKPETNYVLDEGNEGIGSLEQGPDVVSDISGKASSWFGDEDDESYQTGTYRLSKLEEIRRLLRKLQN